MFSNTVAKGWREHLANIFGTYGLTWIWVVLAVSTLKWILSSAGAMAEIDHVPFFSVLPGLISSHWPNLAAAISASMFLQVFLAVICAPVFEEILFRLLPLTLVQNSRPQVIFAVQLAVCGVIFGWAHGSPLNIFIQGAGGFMLGRLYIANSTSMLASWGSCALVHAMYNLTVIMVWGG